MSGVDKAKNKLEELGGKAKEAIGNRAPALLISTLVTC